MINIIKMNNDKEIFREQDYENKNNTFCVYEDKDGIQYVKLYLYEKNNEKMYCFFDLEDLKKVLNLNDINDNKSKRTKWFLTNFYVTNKDKQYMHHVVLDFKYDPQKDLEVDHINVLDYSTTFPNRRNNRRNNLRLLTRKEQVQNQITTILNMKLTVKNVPNGMTKYDLPKYIQYHPIDKENREFFVIEGHPLMKLDLITNHEKNVVKSIKTKQTTLVPINEKFQEAKKILANIEKKYFRYINNIPFNSDYNIDDDEEDKKNKQIELNKNNKNIQKQVDKIISKQNEHEITYHKNDIIVQINKQKTDIINTFSNTKEAAEYIINNNTQYTNLRTIQKEINVSIQTNSERYGYVWTVLSSCNPDLIAKYLQLGKTIKTPVKNTRAKKIYVYDKQNKLVRTYNSLSETVGKELYSDRTIAKYIKENKRMDNDLLYTYDEIK